MRLRRRSRDPIHIACSIDEGWLPHLATTLHSLLTHEPTPVHVHVLAAELGDDDTEALTTMTAELGGELSIVTPELEAVRAMPDFISPVLWYRTFVAETLTELERVICMDTDLLFTAPVRELWETDLGESLLGAVATVFPGQAWGDRHCASLGLRRDQYFNNGVALMDLERLRRDRTSDKIAEFALSHLHLLPPEELREATGEEFIAHAREHPEQLLIPEQDATNAAVAGRWLRLHPRWNCMHQVARRPLSDEVFGAAVVEQALAAPAIRHFEGPDAAKPWHPGAEPSAHALYRTHRQRTPWASTERTSA